MVLYDIWLLVAVVVFLWVSLFRIFEILEIFGIL
jgi:hypothetical protein